MEIEIKGLRKSWRETDVCHQVLGSKYLERGQKTIYGVTVGTSAY